MKLSVIIINYNSKSLLSNCLDSLEKWADDCIDEIIVVDNNSTKEKLEQKDFQEYQKVRFFGLDQNLGFGAANNYAIKKATNKYLLLLNPDTLLVDDSVKKMLQFYSSRKNIGALTCLLYGSDSKTLQKSFFGKFQSLFSITIRRYNFQKIDFSKDFMPTDIVTGACLMIEKRLFEKLGGFDEKFFMYLEDDDLCRRLINQKYQNGVYVKAKIIHLEGKSSESDAQKKIFYYKSQDYYWSKHNGITATILMKIIRWPYKTVKQSSKKIISGTTR